jgi:hypothetical protein
MKGISIVAKYFLQLKKIITNKKSWQVQVKNDILVEKVSQVSMP